MKNTVKLVLMAWVTSFALNSCLPKDDYDLGSLETVTLDQVTFTYAATSKSDNVIQFTNTSTVKGIHSLSWNLGNGITSTARNPVGTYPEAGDYTVSLTVTTADGNVVVRTQTVKIAKDDPTLFDTPVYRKLTGGPDNAKGKTWVFDQYNLYLDEVRNATGKNIKGHMGLGPAGSYGSEWWGAGPNEKSYENTLGSVGHGWNLYDWKLTFSMAGGLLLKIETAGEGYGRNALKGGFNYVWNNGDDMAFPFAGGNFTYSLANADAGVSGYPELTLSGSAFTGYYVGTQVYDIIYLSEEVMALRALNSAENQDWIFIYIREDLNKEPVGVVKTPKAVPISEDFEGAELTAPLKFDYEAMGSLTNQHYYNPAPVPINQSGKVFLYEKGSGSAGYWANVSYTTTDYKFDLTTQNMIRMKVFLPGYNDYTTAGQGESWAPKTLQKMVAVKLQDSSRGGNAWETQTQKDFTNLPTDTWISLTFDFSDVANREDYDKIVIQFGGEGHNRTGIFFFDDFKFDVYEEDPSFNPNIPLVTDRFNLARSIETVIEGENFHRFFHTLEKNAVYTLIDLLSDANILYNVDFFERTATDKVKFLGESGDYFLYYNPVRKNVIISPEKTAELPNHIIIKGFGFGYPTRVSGSTIGEAYPGRGLTNFEVWDDKNVMQYILFRKIEDGVFQGTCFMPGQRVGWGFADAAFKVYEGVGQGDNNQLVGADFTGGFSGTATEIINELSPDAGDFVIGPNSGLETKLYRFTVDLNNMSIKIDNFVLP